jgi:hypothetical protein
MSSSNDKPDSLTAINPSVCSLVSGIYGSIREPLHPSTRSYKRQLMESTISDLLDKLDYTGFKYSESKKKCKNLKNMLLTKNEEILFLVNEVAVLKKEKQDMLDDYQDLFERYHKSKN